MSLESQGRKAQRGVCTGGAGKSSRSVGQPSPASGASTEELQAEPQMHKARTAARARARTISSAMVWSNERRDGARTEVVVTREAPLEGVIVAGDIDSSIHH